MKKESVKLDGGKYEVISYEDGNFECLRAGREWRNLVGDNVALHMFYKIKLMEEGWNELKSKISAELVKEFEEFFEE